MARGLVIDCFAGGGGASLGIRQALGYDVDIAINHDPLAIAVHKANHPSTLHVTEDIFSVNLADYVGGRDVALMWASPDCTHFSKARGGKPRSQHIRMLPWAVHKHAQAVKPQVIIMENVAEIQTWEDYGDFVAAMVALGYRFSSKVLCAADYGARTSRTRWYAVFRRDGMAPQWPVHTHASRQYLQGTIVPELWPLKPWLSIGLYLDTDIGKPVEGRKKPLAPKTLARIQQGNDLYRDRDGSAWWAQWIMSYYGTGVGQSIHEPLRTITCKDRFALVTATTEGTYMRMLTPMELKRAQGFPAPYVIDHHADGTPVPKAAQVKLIGNSVVPLMAKKIVAANVAA